MDFQIGDQVTVTPDFALSVFTDADGVQLLTNQPARPDVRKHANLGLLYGVAILALERDGTIERKVDELLAQGPLSEVDAVNRIAILIDGDPNAPAAVAV